jgi:hypothetical protein|tara:strand:+ start:561 stop:713 length:153 start_codon:yes stop_codon:yes gene_type:complete
MVFIEPTDEEINAPFVGTFLLEKDDINLLSEELLKWANEKWGLSNIKENK